MKRIIFLIATALIMLIFSRTTETVEMPEILQQMCGNCGNCPGPGKGVCTCFDKMVFQDASLNAIFALLSKTSPTSPGAPQVNIVLDQDIDIRIRLNVENISWCQLFKLLLKQYDLRATEQDGYIRIVTEENYWKERFAEKENEKKEKQFIDTETRILHIKNATASNIMSIIKPALSSRGQMVVDPATNSLVITELPENFPVIEALADSLDVLGRQIKITCEIVQIDQSALNELGVKWNASKIHITSKDAVSLSSNMDQVSGATGGGLGRFTYGIITNAMDLSNQVSAVISEGKAKILDQPHIITADNLAAEIFSGKQIPINTLDQAGNLVTQFFQIGTKVKITPHIAADSKVKLKLTVERSGYTVGSNGYEITTRTVNTEMTVSSGDAVVIGGLTTEEFQKDEHGIPFLKSIPIIGALFRYSSESTSSSVITIFITPEILPQ